MNSKLPFTIKPDSLDEIKKKAQDMRLEIAQRRAQRDAEIALR